MSFLAAGLKIKKSSDQFLLSLCDGEVALTATLYWEPADFKKAVLEFTKEMSHFPEQAKKVIFLDDFQGENFPPQWDRRERFSLSLEILDKKPALVAQNQKPDQVGLQFVRVIWVPRTGDSLQRLSQSLQFWVNGSEFAKDDSEFKFVDERR